MHDFLEKFKKVAENTRDSVEGIQQDLQFDIVQFILDKLQEQNLSKSELASRIKMKESQLSRILNAEVNLTLESIARIYGAFQCRPKISERVEKKPSRLAATSFQIAESVASSAEDKWHVSTTG